MEKKILIVIVLLLALGCENKDDSTDNKNIPPELIGKWKVVEVCSSEAEPGCTWSPYDSGDVYDIWFKENMEILVSSMTGGCQQGSYSFSTENEIIINLPCTEQSIIPVESLTESILITNTTYIEYELTKYEKVME